MTFRFIIPICRRPWNHVPAHESDCTLSHFSDLQRLLLLGLVWVTYLLVRVASDTNCTPGLCIGTASSHLCLRGAVTVTLKTLMRLLNLFSASSSSDDSRLLQLRLAVGGDLAMQLLLFDHVLLLRFEGLVGLLRVETLAWWMHAPVCSNSHLRLLGRLDVEQHVMIQLVVLPKVNVVACLDVLG